jgi:hypothetical protein
VLVEDARLSGEKSKQRKKLAGLLLAKLIAAKTVVFYLSGIREREHFKKTDVTVALQIL